MGDYGKIASSAYLHRGMTARRIEDLERAVSDWLATKPGSFSSRDACGLYETALSQFKRHSGRSETRDEFEIALARRGFRAGVLVFNGESRWLLVLPSSIETAFERIVAAESRLA